MRTYANMIDQAIDLHSGPASSEAGDSPIDRGWFVRETSGDKVTYLNTSPMPRRMGAEFIATEIRIGMRSARTTFVKLGNSDPGTFTVPEGSEFDVVSNYGIVGLPPECVALGHDYISTGACRRCDLDHAESDAWVAMEATLDLFV
jgi:hypothetical protein